MPRLASRAGRSSATFYIGWSDSMTEQPRPSGVERFLNLFTEVRPGEARTALLLALNVFLILMAYYILKTVREALILGEGTAELKSYLSAGQVVVLAFVVPYYGRLVARFPAHHVDQHRHGLLRHLLRRCSTCWRRLGVPLADDLLRLDRHLQPDDRRAVLVVRQRRVHEGGRRAPARHRRPGRLARRGRRRRAWPIVSSSPSACSS